MSFLYYFRLLLYMSSLMIVFAKKSESDLILLIKDNKTHAEYWCITNGSEPITWLDTKNPNENGDALNPIFYANGNTEFDNLIEINARHLDVWEVKGWKLQTNSFNYEMGLVLDERWERFTTTITHSTIKLDFKQVATIDNNVYFEIPFSVRIKQDAFLFLCTSSNTPPDSNCYWIMLGIYDNTKFGMRKCFDEKVDKYMENYPQKSCKPFVAQRNETGLLNETRWRHFVLTKRNNTLALIHDSKQLLNYTDKEISEPKKLYLFLSSRNWIGHWKIHNCSFIGTTKMDFYSMGTPLKKRENETEICISMYVFICKHCLLSVHLSQEDSESMQVYQEEYKWKDGWQHIKFKSRTRYGNYSYTIGINTTSKMMAEGFWAIDSVRQCYEKDYRISVMKSTRRKHMQCQLLDGSRFVEKTVDKGNGFLCDAETEMGNSCFDCSTLNVNATCSKREICEMNNTSNNINCYCAAGFKGDYCQKTCDGNSYGRNCAKTCGHCYQRRCNKSTGHCEKCEHNYNAPLCQDTILPVATITPEIVKITPTTVTVNAKDPDFSISVNKPAHFIIQYKEFEKKREWESYKQNYSFYGNNENITIKGLKKTTKYVIRYILLTNQGTNTTAGVPKKQFETPCTDVQQNEIEITASNTSATIYLSTTDETCDIANYNYTINDNSGSTFNSNNEYSVSIPNLQPYHNYTFKLYKNNSVVTEKSFITKEGVPTKVKSLKTTNVTNTTIHLTWEEPNHLNGILQHYVIEYKHKSYRGCPQGFLIDTAMAKKTTKITNYVLNKLKPYSNYEITVFAKNSYNGAPSTLKINTTQTNIVTDDELPQGKPKIVCENSKIVHVSYDSSSDCTKRQGPIYLNITRRCLNEWCNARTETQNFSISANVSFTLNNLNPYSKYEVMIHAKRNVDSQVQVMVPMVSFQTHAIAPGVVRNITVYCKDENSASLRWLPPYPPNGELERYSFEIINDSINETVPPIPCDLWPQFHCNTITGLKPDQYYNVTVFAKNKDVKEIGEFAIVKFITKQEQSERPKNLSATWNEFNNTLLLKWEHPDVTNGPIVAFDLEISCNESRQYRDTIKINKTRRLYQRMLTLDNINKKFACAKCKISLSAKTANEGLRSQTNVQFPPAVPRYEMKPKSIENTSNTTIKIGVPSIISSDHYYSCTFIFVDVKNYSRKPRVCSDLCGNSDILEKGTIVYAAESAHFQRDSYFVFGNVISENDKCETRSSYVPVSPRSCYNITFLLMNTCPPSANNTLRSFQSYTVEACTGGIKQIQKISAYWFFLIILILTPIAVLLVMRYKQSKYCQPASMVALNIRERCRDVNTDLLPLNTPPTPQSLATRNKSSTVYSKPIKLSDFENYVKHAIQTGDLEHQHQVVATLPSMPCEYGKQKPNKIKNRYGNLIAYDHTRVILDKIENDSFSDYINANFINGYNTAKAYIATQGPKSNTVCDFWRMIWQENVQHIIMVANIYEEKKKKVEKYWPDINDKIVHGDITVECSTTTTYPEYERRSFIIRKGQEKRVIQQLHFTSWPDHGVPLYSQSLVPFLKEILTIPTGSSPVVVHCSAGVGRTGTIILCDICLRMAAAENRIDVLNQLHHLRQQRANMVDNPEQYKLVHLVLLDMLFAPETSIPCNNEMEAAIKRFTKKSTLKAHMRYLNETLWCDNAAKTVARRKSALHDDRFLDKNRFPDIVPEELCAVHLTAIPSSNHNTYINAVVVEGFKNLNKYIVTQQPLPNTVVDFWRMVIEMEVKVIVSINDINLDDKTSIQFWPDKGAPPLKILQHVAIILLDTIEYETHHVIVLDINTSKHEMESRKKVYVVQMKGWSNDKQIPPSLEGLLTIWQEMEVLSKGSQYTVVSCYDGATASGLLVALSFIIERIKLQHVCDVCLAVRSIRRSRKQFVNTEEQFQFLYNAALLYVRGFQTYSNFSQH